MAADMVPTGELRLTLPARAESVAVARRVVGAVAEAMALPRERRDAARLAVTEACANVVRHAYDGDGPLIVRVRQADDVFAVEVLDQGRGLAPNTSSLGLGLPLIAALADAVEVAHSAGAGSRVAMRFGGAPDAFEPADARGGPDVVGSHR